METINGKTGNTGFNNTLILSLSVSLSLSHTHTHTHKHTHPNTFHPLCLLTGCLGLYSTWRTTTCGSEIWQNGKYKSCGSALWQFTHSATGWQSTGSQY